MGKRVEDWRRFSRIVEQHIEQTERGHYAGGGSHGIDVMEFLEGFLGADATIAWLKDVVKYVCRYPRTDNQIDLFKAAHYLCRIWITNHRTKDLHK